jgi:hypothetical protein
LLVSVTAVAAVSGLIAILKPRVPVLGLLAELAAMGAFLVTAVVVGRAGGSVAAGGAGVGARRDQQHDKHSTAGGVPRSTADHSSAIISCLSPGGGP